MSQPTPFFADENAFLKSPETGDTASPATPPASSATTPSTPAFTMPPQPEEDMFETTRKWLLDLADEVERINPDLPTDMAQNHGRYAHGSPVK